jgi:hypothetical protein
LLVQSLGDWRAASAVVRLSELGDRSVADVVLIPRLRGPVEFRYEGWSNTWWASAGLWLVTWIGGMAVNDSTYRTEMVVDYELHFPRGDHVVPRRATSRTVDTTFLERNDFFSWPTVQSLVLPPFLTTDQQQSTSEVLTRRAVEGVAVDIARYLKRDFDADARDKDFCAVQFAEPRNGAEVEGDAVTVRGTIVSRYPVGTVTMRVGGSEAVAAFDSAPSSDGLQRTEFRCDVRGLRPGDNFINVVVTAGDEHTRTLVVRRNAEASGR